MLHWKLVTKERTAPERDALEREVLSLMERGVPLAQIRQQLALAADDAQAIRKTLLRRFGVRSARKLLSGARSRSAETATGRFRQVSLILHHQSRWLPDVPLSRTGSLGIACREVIRADTLRDAADALCEMKLQPNPAPDDPLAVLAHGSGSVGARQALLAALAQEAGRQDVALVLACYESIADSSAADRQSAHALPQVVCFLQFCGKAIQVTYPGFGSQVRGKALAVSRVEPLQMAAERLSLYQKFAADWCLALDATPETFAGLRSRQLRRAGQGAGFEDQLGHRLSADYRPSL